MTIALDARPREQGGLSWASLSAGTPVGPHSMIDIAIREHSLIQQTRQALLCQAPLHVTEVSNNPMK